jgi:hypothetical protein
VGYTCNPSTLEAEAGRSQVQDQPGYIIRPCLKRKKWGGKERAEKDKEGRKKDWGRREGEREKQKDCSFHF